MAVEAHSHSRLVLFADGNRESARYVTRTLRSTGYEVLLASNIESLLKTEARQQPATLLLDEEFPDCVNAISQVREASGVPIIIMSFANEELAAAGLRQGADAVLMKPFSAELLVAQMESLSARTQVHPQPSGEETYRYRDLIIDFIARTVRVRGQRTHLSLREYRLLQVLALNGGRVVTHGQLLRQVWGPGYEESGELLRGYVRNLRRKLGDDARSPRFVFTEGQVGYWMERSERPQLLPDSSHETLTAG